MEVSAVALQQAGANARTAVAMVKKAAEADQAVVNLIAQSSPSSGRGQIVDVTA